MFCIVCGAEIPKKRLEIMPGTKTCVNHSTTGKLVGMPVIVGKGDDTYTDLNIMSEEVYKQIIKPTPPRDILSNEA